jgi:hypothetical protein
MMDFETEISFILLEFAPFIGIYMLDMPTFFIHLLINEQAGQK